MGRSRVLSGFVGLALIVAITAMGGRTANADHILAVGLGTAAPFAVLAGTPNITDVPISTISGDVGLSPATGAGIGVPCAEVSGTIYNVDGLGAACQTMNPVLLGLAKGALTTALGDAAGRAGGLSVAADQLAGKILNHGVYKSAAALDLAVNGTLTLDGQGDPGAVFIFQVGPLGGAGSLTIGNGTTVKLLNLAQSCNIFWQVDSATIGSTAAFKGTVLAATAITVANGSTIEGRLLAGTANVTLISDTITVPPICAAAAVPAPAPAVTPAPTTTPTAGPIVTPIPAATPTPTPTSTPTPTPSPRPVLSLPSTSTGDQEGAPAWIFVLALAVLSVGMLIRIRARRPEPAPRR